jgi:hypothetical protein
MACEEPSHQGGVYDARNGRPWPPPAMLAGLRRVWLEVPGWGTNVGNTVTLILYSGGRWRGIGLETDGPNPMWFRWECNVHQTMAVDIIYSGGDPFQLVALLGLVGRALSHVAAAPGAARRRNSQRTFRMSRHNLLDTCWQYIPWRTTDWAHEDIQRALIVVKMLAYRFKDSLPHFDLLW